MKREKPLADQAGVTRIGYGFQIAEIHGFEILHNGVPRTFRDRKGSEAARDAKNRCRDELIEIRDTATGEKVVMMADGRTS